MHPAPVQGGIKEAWLAIISAESCQVLNADWKDCVPKLLSTGPQGHNNLCTRSILFSESSQTITTH